MAGFLLSRLDAALKRFHFEMRAKVQNGDRKKRNGSVNNKRRIWQEAITQNSWYGLGFVTIL